MDRRVFGRRDWLWFLVAAALHLAALGWALARLAQHSSLWREPVAWVVLLPAAGALLSFQARWFSLALMRVPVPMAPEPGQRIAAVTTFVPGLEPLAMLRRTLRAMVAMRLGHDTWVLDEGDDPEVRRLCEELGVRHFSREGQERYQQPSGTFQARSKHGNYNAWLDAVGYAAYDVIVGFDPDHIPSPAFLERTVGYLRDPRIGYVQAAQTYYNQPAGFIARGAAEETYAYYSSVQMVSYALGYPIVTGCHNVHRATALREVGGFAAHDADDLLITVHYRRTGWRGVYVPERLADGITPVDWSGYLTQQRRWARSVLDVKLRVFPRVARQLPLVERAVSTLHGLYYLHGLATSTGVVVLTLALALGWQPAIPMGVALPAALAVVASLVLCEAVRQRHYLDPATERGLHLRGGLLKFAKWPWVLLALIDAVRASARDYAVTAKVPGAPRSALGRAHGAAVGAIVLGGTWGVVAGNAPARSLLGIAAAFVGISLVVIGAGRLPVPLPYDDELAAARVPWGASAPAAPAPDERVVVPVR